MKSNHVNNLMKLFIINRYEFYFITAIMLWMTCAIMFNLTNIPLEIGAIRDNHPYKSNTLYDFWTYFTMTFGRGDEYLDADSFYFHMRRQLDALRSNTYSFYTIFGYWTGSEIESPKFIGFLISKILIEKFKYSIISAALTSSVIFTGIYTIFSVLINLMLLNGLGIQNKNRIFFVIFMSPAIFGYQYEAYQISILGYNLLIAALALRVYSDVLTHKLFFLMSLVGVSLVCVSADFHNILYLPILFVISVLFLAVFARIERTDIVVLLCAYALNLVFFASNFAEYYYVISTSAQSFDSSSTLSEKGLYFLIYNVFIDGPLLGKLISSTTDLPNWLLKNPTVKLNLLAVLVLLISWKKLQTAQKLFTVLLLIIGSGYLHLLLGAIFDIFASETSVKLYVLLNLPLLLYAACYLNNNVVSNRSRVVEIVLLYLWLEVALLVLNAVNGGDYPVKLPLVAAIASILYFGLIYSKPSIQNVALFTWFAASGVGLVSTGNLSLREINSYEDFYVKMSNILPKDSIVTIYASTERDNVHPNIFMGHQYYSTEGYLSPTPFNYATALNSLTSGQREDFRYKDLPRASFFGETNQEFYDKKLQLFSTDYILSTAELDDFTPIWRYGKYLISEVKRPQQSWPVKVEVCSLQYCRNQTVKYKKHEGLPMLLLRFDSKINVRIDGDLIPIKECLNYFICLEIENEKIIDSKIKVTI